MTDELKPCPFCGFAGPHDQGFNYAEAKLAWRPIETAPKDGTEILAWRDDCGVVIVAWTCQSNLMTDDEIEKADLGDSADDCDWFSAYGFGCDWMSGTEAPTHWMPIPNGPSLDAILAPGGDDPKPKMAVMPLEQWQRLVSLIEARVPWDQEEVDELISKVRVVG